MSIIEKVWPQWKVEKKIGTGAYATVYKCSSGEGKSISYSAVKVISVPHDQQDIYEVSCEGLTREQTKAYYQDIANDLIKEIEMLKSLKGNKNIVEIYDAAIVEKDDGVGWNILIRMELLTDFNTYISDKRLSESDVINLGIDLSNALSVCHKAKIIHRDIKPENIFVDEKGNFKLGDFGVAKQMEKTRGSMSVKGTYVFMAPEVYAGKKCDSRADVYSLALVMYKLLNNNRLPFIDPDKQLVKYSERQQAFEKRIRGEKLPVLFGVSRELNGVILKACAFRSVDRHKSIDEFCSELVKLKKGKKVRKKKNYKSAFLGAAAAVIMMTAVLTATIILNEELKSAVSLMITPTQEPETTQPAPEVKERSYNDIRHINFNTNNSFSSDYSDVFISETLADGEEGVFIVDTADNKSTDIMKVIGENGSDCYTELYDGENIYYYKQKSSSDGELAGYDIIKYNLAEGNKELLYSDDSNIISSIVYCDEEYLYLVENNSAFSRGEEDNRSVLKRIGLKFDDDYTIDDALLSVVLYKGYILFLSDSNRLYKTSGTLWCYDTFSHKEHPITDNGFLTENIFFKGDKMYFIEGGFNYNHEAESAESTMSAEILICEYDFASMEYKTVFDLSEYWKNYSYEDFIGRFIFNDKYAQLPGEEQDSYVICSYENKSYSKISIPQISEDCYSWAVFSADGNISDNLLLMHSTGYGCRLYEVLWDGSLNEIGNELYINFDKCNVQFYGTKAIVYNATENKHTVYDFTTAEASNVVYEGKNELVIVTSSVNIRIGPDSKYDSLGFLKEGDILRRIAQGSNNWSKVIYNENQVYIASYHLSTFEPTDKDFKNLETSLSQLINCSYISSYSDTSQDAFTTAMNYLLDSGYGVYDYYCKVFAMERGIISTENEYDEKNGAYISEDPLKRFEGEAGYTSFPADKVERLLSLVFGLSADRSYSQGSWYYYNGRYYFPSIAENGTQWTTKTDYHSNTDTLYFFELTVSNESESFTSRCRATAELKFVDNIRYWQVRSIEFLMSQEAQEYKSFLYDNFTDNEYYYSVFDINKDSVKELIVYEEKSDKTKCRIYSYEDREVKKLHEFSFDSGSLYILPYYNALCYYADENSSEALTLLLMDGSKVKKAQYTPEADEKDLREVFTYSTYDYSALRY